MSITEDEIVLPEETVNRFSSITEEELKSSNGTKNMENIFMDIVKKINEQRIGKNVANLTNNEDESKMMNFIIEKTRHQTKIETLEEHVIILENLIDQLRAKENEVEMVIKTYQDKNNDLNNKIENLETELFEKIEENIKLNDLILKKDEKMNRYFFFSTVLFSFMIIKYIQHPMNLL